VSNTLINNNDRMAGRRETTLRNIPKPKVKHGERPFVYPIFYPLTTGEAE